MEKGKIEILRTYFVSEILIARITKIGIEINLEKQNKEWERKCHLGHVRKKR